MAVAVIALIDHLVPAQFQRQQQLQQQARMLIVLLLIFLSSIVITTLVHLANGNLSNGSRLVSLLFSAALLLFFSWLLYFFRVTGNYKVCLHGALATVTAILFLSECITGGPSQSSIGQLFVIVPIAAFACGDKQTGIQWTVTVLVLQSLLSALSFSGLEFIQVANQTDLIFYQRFNWAIVALVVVTMFAVFECTSIRVTERYSPKACTPVATTLPLRQFEQQLKNTCQRARRQQTEFAVLSLHAPLFGSESPWTPFTRELQSKYLLEHWHKELRRSDLVCADGQGRFLILLPGAKQQQALQSIVENLIKVSETPIHVDGQIYHAKVHIGAASYPAHGNQAKTLLQAARQASHWAHEHQIRWSACNEWKTQLKALKKRAYSKYYAHS